MSKKTLVWAVLWCALFAPSATFAATAAKSTAVKPRTHTSLVIAGWIPYWKKASGIPEAMAHLPQLSEVSPFSYEVADDGTIRDSTRFDSSPWSEMAAAARSRKVKIIPTIAWFHGKAIHATLSTPSSRHAHVKEIVAMTTRNNFDGIDINYEAKIIDSKSYFSQFITELGPALHDQKKLLMCTIEPRTPPSALYTIPPKHIEYVNDYIVLNKYCDAVRIMTYDQTTVDLHLNGAKGHDQLYAPVADTDWVKKVAMLAAKTISPKKIMLGIPTYGYEYMYNPQKAAEPLRKLRTISHNEALLLAAAHGSVPVRNNAGELSFQYRKQGTIRYVSWSDAGAVGAKVKLAKSLKVRGVAVFKIDGETDPGIWKVLQ